MDTAHTRLMKNVKVLAGKKKMTMEALALVLDKDKAHLSRVLSGKKKASLDLAQQLADALGVDLQALFKK